MIPTLNCAGYLRKALKSVLQQDLGPAQMQIEVIDDHSTEDDPEAVVKELGAGRVVFYRQAQNVGHTRNFETCLQRARGRLIHLLHGDDEVLPGFYQKLQPAFEQHPEIGAAFCRYVTMDGDGNWRWVSFLEHPTSGILENWVETLATGGRIQTPAMVVRREVYEKLGGFDRTLTWCEDWEMWMRVSTNYPIWFEVEPLALYRAHVRSSTARHMYTGAHFEDLRRGFQICRSYLPNNKADELFKKHSDAVARYTLDFAADALNEGKVEIMFTLIKGALRLRPSFPVVRQVSRLLKRYIAAGLRHKMRKFKQT